MNTVGIKATAYCLNFAPELALHYGGTPVQERRSGRDPGFLQALEAQAQTYEQAQAYAPNKTYIGAMSIDELQAAPRPWTEHPCEPARFGKFGEIMPEDELLGLMDICDVFDLIWLEEGFAARIAQRLARDPVLGPEQLGRLEKGHPAAEIAEMVEQHHALPLYHEGRVVGCCRRAHDTDENLSADIMLENLACKASGVLSLLHLIRNAGLAPGDIDFVWNVLKKPWATPCNAAAATWPRPLPRSAAAAMPAASTSEASVPGPWLRSSPPPAWWLAGHGPMWPSSAAVRCPSCT